MRLAVLGVAALLLFGILVSRLWFLQILSGDEFTAQANNQRLREVLVQAPRGVIYDRDGDPLVVNRAGLSVGILPMDLRSAGTVIPRLATVLGIPPEDIWKKLDKAGQDKYRVVTIMQDVPENPVVSYLLEHSLEFPGVRVEKSYLREYPQGALATHTLGYVGEASEADLKKEQFLTLKAGAVVGKDGVESIYDSMLRGADGSRTVEVNAAGVPKRMSKEIQPLPGSNLVLTVDTDLEAVAREALISGIKQARADGFTHAAAGVIVALDPRTGEVLAMTSYPDYDPSLWVGGMSAKVYADLISPERNNPLFDRATKGLYPAASTFKPFVAATALKSDLVDWTQVYSCRGTFSRDQRPWRCWLPEGHGDNNLVEALAKSCDVYFYNLGSKFYDQKGPVLQDGLREFGFGQRTGIDLPDEYAGRVPDSEWKKKNGKSDIERIWKSGDDVNLSIGQGDLLVTPLQLAVAFSAIANGGDILVPRVARQITDASGNVTKQFETEVRSHVDISAEDLDAIRRGLRMVTGDPSGTAYGAFRGFPIPVVGKTGTAEKKPGDDYAWFMGYAPADDPEILVVALIEQGGHGSSIAAPAVRGVLEAYFNTESSGPTRVEVTE
ncbi:MAG: penicillin-binding protein 2 [Thermoleophilia bacterium]